MPHSFFRRVIFIGLLIGSVGCVFSRAKDERESKNTREGQVKPIPDSRVQHLYRWSEKVFSGGQPDGVESFQALYDYGVRTLISVDGIKPDWKTAEQVGLRTIHLPITYREITNEQSLLLAKAVQDATGGVYIHCHHGRHRSPAATALVMVALGELSPEDAVAGMRECQTGSQYRGLYQAVSNAQSIDKNVLEQLKVEWKPEVQATGMVQAMVLVQACVDRLAVCREAGWKVPEQHPDLVPAHESLQLLESLKEMDRSEFVKHYPEPFHALGREAIAHVQQLEANLRSNVQPETIERHWIDLNQTCIKCHQQYRNQ